MCVILLTVRVLVICLVSMLLVDMPHKKKKNQLRSDKADKLILFVSVVYMFHMSVVDLISKMAWGVRRSLYCMSDRRLRCLR